jgi:hypothetical protein
MLKALLIMNLLLKCRLISVVLGMALLLFTATPVIAQADSIKADGYFKEAEELCERENGRLWGITLCGPMVIADAVSGTIATNQPAPDEPRPRVFGYANATPEWGDKDWTVLLKSGWIVIPGPRDGYFRVVQKENQTESKLDKY